MRIVGEGEMRPFIEDFIRKNKLENNISLEGAIFDENVLAEQFKKAILCFSPLQAGLSVPKSMGYGVPFVTQKNAITGGELYHITSGENGVMYDNSEELVEIMKDAILDSVKYINMGIAAQQYYYGKATVDHMAQGAISAFDFVLSKRENN
ncbi:glycosyltransferase [Bacteroides uniformis]|uniref:glycosyltransferase n=1 Tax=Bacteroides uniformis TaxID=820 RepID=UPI0021CF49D3|nr:glycosyltransferase [Bacteroides uniformis]